MIMNRMKGLVMEVFGEEYDLSNATPEEIAQVKEWYEKNKHEKVSVASDTAQGTVPSEYEHGAVNKPTDDLNFELAVELLRGTTEFSPKLDCKARDLQLYQLVHPCGHNLRLVDAARMLGISRLTAYRRLKVIKARNPDTYDLDKWPTKGQCDVYRLIHPDLGGLTRREAAKALNASYQHVNDLICRMRKTHPQAFAFERLARPTIQRLNPEVHDEQVKEKF